MTGRDLPTGTLTFLFSDMEGSTRLVADLGPAVFTEVLERHNAILREAFAEHGGVERGTQGDSFLVVFREAPAALEAAAAAQRAVAATTWPPGAPVRVRMGIHTGVGTLGGDDYVGLDVNRAARISGAAHGGEVLVSAATRALTDSGLPPGLSFRDLGSHRLRDIGRPEELHRLVIEGLPDEFPPPRVAGIASEHLPQRVTSFVGRERELEELGRLLADSRLLTLTGPGGTGKTSLGLELARASADAFPQGAWWIPLEGVADASFVEPTMAARLGLLESPGRSVRERLTDFLADRSILLVLDNFEHVLPAASLVGDLLQAAPGLKVVVTSRAPLHLAAEQEYPVAPLALPGPIDPPSDALASPAIRLFVERARRVRPDYELSSDDAPAVAEICRRLDGLPLGIELAASRIGLLPPRNIAERLARRLDLPGTGSRDVPARQRSLQQAIAWSYELLEPSGRQLLDRLSSFSGGCRLEEAEAVCGPPEQLGMDVIDGLSALVDHSLVQPQPGPEGPRFRLLDTIRMFAADRLVESGEADEIRRRHALAFLDLAEAAAAHLPGRGQTVWLARLVAEHDNLRAALRWAIDASEAEIALRFAAASWRFWQSRGFLGEGRALVREILAMPRADAPTGTRMRALDAAGGLEWWAGDVPRANDFYTAQLQVARELGDRRGTADALFNLTHSQFVLGATQAKLNELREAAAELYRELGDERALARTAWTQSYAYLEAGDNEGQRDLMLRLVPRFEELGDDFYLALATLPLAAALLATGDHAGAIRWGVRGLRAQLDMGDLASTTLGLRAAAIFLLSTGRPHAAATAFSAFAARSESYGLGLPANIEAWAPFGFTTDGVNEILSSDEFAVDSAAGAAMTLDEAVDYLTRVAAAMTDEPRAGANAAPA